MKKLAFTIIEIAIVLVVVGLLSGGIVMGRSLIREAELRSIVTQKEATVSYIYTFKNKFNAIPGDMKDAQSVWGAAADCSVAQTTAATCNGNGDGVVSLISPNGNTGNELFLFWKHLSNAGLISGSFTGATDGANLYSATVNNVPTGKISGSLWYINYEGPTTIGSGSLFDGLYRDSFYYGSAPANSAPWGSIITASEMFALDSKIDDGKPGTGILRVRIYGSCAIKADGVTAATFSDTTTAIYRINSTGNQCALIFPNIL